MTRTIAFAALVFTLIAGTARAEVGIGIGVYGGLSVPIVQEDVTQGSLFGVRVPVKLIPLMTLEPYYLSSALGDGEETLESIEYTREGFEHTGVGVNGILGTVGGSSFSFYPYAGIGSHKLERTGTEIKETAYNVGLGFSVKAAHKISLQIRGELNMVVTGDTSRKFGHATVGLNYHLLP
jgi:hypothetical protein